MTIAIDAVGTNLGCGTKTYNINLCNELNSLSLNSNIIIFICRSYLNQIQKIKNKKIKYIIKPNFLSISIFRLLWMQLILPFKLLEYIASGRIVVSGPLNLLGTKLQWLLSGIIIIDLKAKLWLDSVLKITEELNLNLDKIKKIIQKAIKYYSYDRFNNNLSKLLKNLKK